MPTHLSLISQADAGALPIPALVYAYVGTTAKKLDNPGSKSFLVLIASKGAWNLRLGDFVSSGMPSAVDPASSVTDGTAGVKLPEGGSLVLPVPATVTVKAYSATDALVYYWL
jgi:hypothetical protein